MKISLIMLIGFLISPAYSAFGAMPQKVVLNCKMTGGRCLVRYSLSSGKIVNSKSEADLMYYFDADDCSQGAIFGHEDQKGYIFTIGHKSWSELVAKNSFNENEGSVAGIMPLTEKKEGTAFWLRTHDGSLAIVKITSVKALTYEGLKKGEIAQLSLEWIWKDSNDGNRSTSLIGSQIFRNAELNNLDIGSKVSVYGPKFLTDGCQGEIIVEIEGWSDNGSGYYNIMDILIDKALILFAYPDDRVELDHSRIATEYFNEDRWLPFVNRQAISTKGPFSKIAGYITGFVPIISGFKTIIDGSNLLDELLEKNYSNNSLTI